MCHRVAKRKGRSTVIFMAGGGKHRAAITAPVASDDVFATPGIRKKRS